MDYKVTDTELTAVADAIRAKGSTSAPLTWESGFASAISAIPTGITPSGTLSIGANGDYDVTNYASASVSVPGLVPSGTYSITSNGVYDVTNYASADVNVSGGGTDTRFKELVERTISGTVEDSTITAIGQYAFVETNIESASFPNATVIGTHAFSYCVRLNSVSFSPNVTFIDTAAFSGCSSLTTASFPNVISIGSYAFAACSSLTQVSFPNATSIYDYAFIKCSSLTTASFPNATTLNACAFSGCNSLTTVSFPNVTSIGSSVFSGCRSLATMSFPSVVTIKAGAFINCVHLLSLYLMGSSIPSLAASSTCFSSTPIGGYTTQTGGVYGSIFVPSSLYNSYITANNWSNYAARFVSV